MIAPNIYLSTTHKIILTTYKIKRKNLKTAVDIKVRLSLTLIQS